MGIKKDKIESAKNIVALRSVCTIDCKEEEIVNLKKFYMNKYGNYMASRIISVILVELLLIFLILNTGIDSIWKGIPYAEAIIYGILWSTGGIYLASMLITVIRNTYDLKMALEAGKVKKSNCDVTFHESVVYQDGKRNRLEVYIKPKKKNELIWFFIHKSKHRKIGFISNIGNESPGTKLIVYSVDDKKQDLFVMVKDRPIGDSADKLLKDAMNSNLEKQKFKLSILKAQLKSNKHTKK